MVTDAIYPIDRARLFPWSRFGARLTDVLLFSFVVGLVIRFGRLQGDLVYGALLANILFYPMYEAALVDFLGWTPGKALLNVRLVRRGDEPGGGVGRAFRVHWYGMGALLPFVYLVTMWLARQRYMKTGSTTWDDQSSIMAVPMGAGPIRWICFCVFHFVLFGAQQVTNELIRG